MPPRRAAAMQMTHSGVGGGGHGRSGNVARFRIQDSAASATSSAETSRHTSQLSGPVWVNGGFVSPVNSIRIRT